jgi:hypothetical protein
MSLLREIQSAAVDQNGEVATLLRKCKILAVRLGNDEFKTWVDRELNGYTSVEELPPYRILQVESFGNFSGPFGSGLENAPIPPSCLPEQAQDLANKSYMLGPISGYASLLDGAERSNPRENWPADAVALFGRKIYQNMACLGAWKLIPRNAIVALIDTIKTRVLNFVLEIEAVAPDAGEAPPNQPPLSQDRVSQVFNTYISGSVQNLATGSTEFSQGGTFTVTTGDFAGLEKVLATMGIPHQDISDLKVAIDEDKESLGEPTMGAKVQSWMGRMVGKAASGAWNVSTSVAATVIGKALAGYFGLT